MSVEIRDDLSPPEINFIKKSQTEIQDALKIHDIHCPENMVPRVALLGSGGGQRAYIGFLGVMRQLGKEDLLGCMQYVAGVSGSTWCVSSLYQDPQWTQHAEEAANTALLSMSNKNSVSFHDGVQWFKQRYAEGDFSLSDVWGVLTCRIKGVSLEQECRPLDQDGNGARLYPLYSAMEKHCFHKGQQKEMWFEFSPHEVGFLEPGAYVETSLLKRDFEGGTMKPVQPVQRKPMDMVQLQGKIDILYILADLMKNYADPEYNLSELERLQCLLGESWADFSPTLMLVEHQSWGGLTDQEKEKHVESIHDELVASVDKWGHDHSQIGGTAGDDDAIPKDMIQEKQMHLIDAGLYLNSPYPSALRAARCIDLIISFDFSDGDPFETLKVTSDYADKNGHPFPNVDFTRLDPKRPKSCYVFEEKGKTTVIHIPVFNMDNCKDEAAIEKERKEYATIQSTYRDKTKINHLADLAAENVTMNRGNILSKKGR
ncbi:cytosolic phospholipase A2 gamma-like [Alosa pseudoharengus]|uniref:cytosolic phospholipase A2 gamma-like n=1 Tax=Alosa pseudoharengus TaxID=34774 RepID=UPI003F8BB6FC